jgi:hypothetical protein
MSAPNQGRQSPEPENQGGHQVGQQVDNPNDQGAQDASKQSGDSLKNLSSNPGGPLDASAEAKTAKGTGNDSGKEAK